MVQVSQTLCDIDRNVEPFLPLHELHALVVEQRVLQATVGHVLVDKHKLAAAAVGGEAMEREDVRGGEGGGDGELVVELTLTLEGARGVHDLESQALAGREGCLVDGAESTVTEEGGGGERGGGAPEEGVGEAALVVVGGGGAVAG